MNGSFLTNPDLRKPYTRHLGGINLGFLDGHVEWRKFGNPQSQGGAIMFKRFGGDAQGFWW
jgi:prepilin-type processing-associated H-X9-DG protein